MCHQEMRESGQSQRKVEIVSDVGVYASNTVDWLAVSLNETLRGRPFPGRQATCCTRFYKAEIRLLDLHQVGDQLANLSVSHHEHVAEPKGQDLPAHPLRPHGALGDDDIVLFDH